MASLMRRTVGSMGAPERSDLDDGSAGEGKAIDPSVEPLQNGAGSPPFISYVAVSSEDEGAQPGGRSAEDLIATEEKAIELILSKEPHLQRTPKNQHGFDLFEPAALEARYAGLRSKR